MTRGPSCYQWYTVWNFTLQTIYFVWSVLDQRRLSRQENTTHLTSLNTLFDIIFANSLLIGIIFWTILYDKNDATWLAYGEHGINTLLLIIEFILNPFLTQWTSIVYASCSLPAAYASFAWISHDTWLSKWPYSFLDVESQYAPVWYLGLLIGHGIFFSITIALSKLKQKYRPTLLYHNDKSDLLIAPKNKKI